MTIGIIVFGFFAVAFTLGALALPYVMRKWMDAAQLSPLHKLGIVLYAFVGTMGLALFAALSTAMLCGYIGTADSTYWFAFLSQTLAIGANLFFWFSRGVQSS